MTANAPIVTPGRLVRQTGGMVFRWRWGGDAETCAEGAVRRAANDRSWPQGTEGNFQFAGDVPILPNLHS
jgi:hypothetical protein